MGQKMTLREVLANLTKLNSEDTIYAAEPWAAESEALVAPEMDAGRLPSEALNLGLKYFLEVSIAREFAEDWLASLETQPTAQEICKRVIDYAVNDA